MSERVLGVFAHPDDETFWCGAALATHVINGDSVTVLVLSDGVGSRGGINARVDAFNRACDYLGVSDRHLEMCFPDQQSDTKPQLLINQTVETFVKQPSRVYTHFVGDLNLDHRRVAEAVLVATRGICPVWMCRPDELGRTLWPFKPDGRRSVKVEPVREQKLAAVQCYPGELRDTGPRSLAHFRTERAEVFEVRA